MIDDLFHDTQLRKSQIMMLLDISESTFYRWQSQKWIPRQAELILRSVAQGLPVMMTRSHWWDGHRFAVDGSLRLPNDYPIYPVDLWTFY